MDNIIKKAFIRSFEHLCSEVSGDKFRHINESVFRYFFIQALYSVKPDIGIEDEWKKIDILVHDKGFHYPIEMKFYDTRPMYIIGSETLGTKGGAGGKNFDEFLASAKKLVGIEERHKKIPFNIGARYFILVAGDRPGAEQYAKYYRGNIHIEALTENGISSEILETRIYQKDKLEIFGWVMKMKKK